MELPPQRRDINELLANGYFKTARGKSPSGFVIASSRQSPPNIYSAEPPLRATRPPFSEPPTMSHATIVEVEVEVEGLRDHHRLDQP